MVRVLTLVGLGTCAVDVSVVSLMCIKVCLDVFSFIFILITVTKFSYKKYYKPEKSAAFEGDKGGKDGDNKGK